MSSSSGSPEVPAGPVQLSGWKEIAAYLGRSVRTVQRWEKEFGLPVRRFGMSRPESVFALPREVDAWLLTAQGINARAGVGAPGPVTGTVSPQREPVFPRTWLVRMALSVLVIAAAAVMLWAVWVYRQPARQTDPRSASPAAAAPADWRVDLDTLVVSDSSGVVLWRHRFPFDMVADSYKGNDPPHELLAGVGDVDGDGLREVWFVPRPANLPAPHESALYLFNSNGSIRWQYRFSGTARFGRETFGPSWIVHKVFVTPDPGGGDRRAIWVVMYDAALFPSLLQRLDPRTGKPLSTYWSNGYIITLALAQGADRRRLFVGACNNEHKASSLAVLDATNPNGSAPAELEKYRCTSCPPGDPDVFLVFPKPIRFGESEQTGVVERITPLADGGVTIGVQHASAREIGRAVAIHTFDAALNPRSVDTADDYLKVYQALVSEGRAEAGAPPGLDPDREFFPILRWDTTARRYVKVFPRR
jgi:hypothetical protein